MDRVSSDVSAVAVVGVAFALPGASNFDELDKMLIKGKPRFQPIPDGRLAQTGAKLGVDYAPAALLEHVDQFDAEFWGLSPREAINMDPHQRILLQLVWAAIEDSGHAAGVWRNSAVGVFMTSHGPGYQHLLPRSDTTSLLGTNAAAVAGRISYMFGFEGPSMVVDTGCSSGLVAVQMARDALARGDCEIAIVGGASLKTTAPADPSVSDSFRGLISPNGTCRAFDDTADGTGDGEGAVVLVLRRLSDALDDGDRPHALIEAAIVRHNGARSNGFSAPSPTAQAELLQEAWTAADVSQDDLIYVEAHGSGTRLGDAIELSALQAATQNLGIRTEISTIKSNIGHLDQVAGLAGVVKAISTLRTGNLYASVGFEHPNGLVKWSTALGVTQKQHARVIDERSKVGISSFSLTGTNAHVVLSGFSGERRTQSPGSFPASVVYVSARSEIALQEHARNLREHIARHPNLSATDIIRTLREGRVHFQYRFAFIASTRTELLEGLYECQLSGSGTTTTFLEATDLAIGIERFLEGDDVQRLNHQSAGGTYRVSLPPYPFVATRFWPQVRVYEQKAADSATPATEHEGTQDLSAIWKRVLGVANPLPDSDYFALGGNSVLALEMLSFIEEESGVRLRLVDLYEAPTLAAMERLVANATRATSSHGSDHVIAQRASKARYQPSFGQESLWVLGQIWPDLNMYNISVDIPLHGDLNVGWLRDAFRGLIDRHQVLRSRIVSQEGEAPEVIVGSDPEPDFEARQITGPELSLRQKWDQAWALARQEARRPFDLANHNPIRIRVYELGSGRWLVLVITHHSVDDGWSPELFVRDLREFYRGAALGLQADLLDLPVTYADFAAWQRSYWTTERIEHELEYWRPQLEGVKPLLIPTDHTRPLEMSGEGDHFEFEMGEELVRDLRAFARAASVSPFCVVMAAYKATISRWSGETDITVGITTAGRDQSEVRDLMGFFNNAVALRTDVSGDLSFAALVQREKTIITEGLRHDMVPFSEVVAGVSHPRDPGRHPIFQAGITYQRLAPSAKEFLPGVNYDEDQPQRIRGVAIGTAKWDLDLGVWDRDGSVTLPAVLEYRTDLWERATIESFASSFVHALSIWIRDPSAAISTTALAAPQQVRNEVEHAVGRASEAVGKWHPLDLFLAASAASPNDEFIRTEGISYSYLEVGKWTRRVVEMLKELRLPSGSRVGTLMEPGVELVASILALWQMGFTWVPLTSALPFERQSFVLNDADVGVVLAAAGDEVSDIEATARRVLVVACPAEEALRPDDSGAPAEPRDAYVLYTSGSTGTPKGVLVGSDALRQYCLHWASVLPVGSVVLTMASPIFDVFVGDVMRALACGGSIVTSKPVHAAYPDALAEVIETNRVTVAEIVPSRARRSLVEWLHQNGRITSLKLMIVGGETWTFEELRRAEAVMSPRTVRMNTYGVTESTVDSVWDETISASVVEEDEGDVPIGLAITNNFAILIQPEGWDPVPQGVVGELCIGGPSLAAGYVNRAAATASQFIPDPFSGRGQRLYRTGDLARRGSNGLLYFVGRRDRQLSVNGVRIEAEGIEAVLREIEHVVDATVATIDQGDGEQALGALIELSQGVDAFRVGDIRLALIKLLPQSHVPTVIVPVTELPRLANAKIDVQRSGQILRDSTSIPRPSSRPPESDLELRLLAIFSRTLNRSIQVTDDFFLSGGTSLAAIRLIAELRGELGIDIAVSTLFRSPSAASLAHDESLFDEKVSSQSLVPLSVPSDGARKLFMVHSSSGDILGYYAFAQELPGVAVWGLAADPDATPSSLEDLAADYLAEIAQVLAPEDELNLAGWSFGGTLAFEMARQWNKSGRLVGFLGLLDSPLEVDSRVDAANDADQLRTMLTRSGEFSYPATFGTSGSEPEQFAEIAAAAREAGVLSESTSDSELRTLIEVNRRHDAALADYMVSPTKISATLFRCEEGNTSADLGWEGIVSDLSVVDVPGDHYQLFRKHSSALAHLVSAAWAGEAS